MLDIRTKILTSNGWSTMGKVQAGDWVYNENGKLCQVLAAHIPEISDRAYRVTFDDGTYIDACSEHKWITWTHSERKALNRSNYESKGIFPNDWYKWQSSYKHQGWNKPRANGIGPQTRTTEEILKTLTTGKRQDTNHCIPLANSLQLPEQSLSIPPYILGSWLGSGSEICIADYQSIKAVYNDFGYGLKKYSNCTYGIKTNSDPLKRFGLYKNKYIPDCYLLSSEKQRIELLQGLMDTDGGIETSGYVSFCNTNKNIIDGLCFLIVSLGMKYRISSRIPKLNGKSHKRAWRVWFRPTIQVFKLARKACQLCFDKKQQLRHKHRMVKSIEPIEPTLMRCLTVDTPSHLFLVTESLIPTHNSRSICEWAKKKAYEMPGSRGAIAASTAADIRDIVIEGESGILAISPPDFMPDYKSSVRRLEWPNGSSAILLSADQPDRFRGPQYHWAIVDELAAWRRPEAWDMLMFGLRLGDDPKVAVATTPRPTPVIIEIMNSPNTFVTTGSTYDNRANLAKPFFDQIITKYEGTRLGRQELNAEILDDNPNALWKRQMIEECRVAKHPKLIRLVVGVDPSGTSGGDAVGIVVAGIGSDGHGYVLNDATLRGSPKEWGMEVIAQYYKFRASRVVAESNFGGELVESNLRAIDETVSYKKVWASRGKAIRAEPVSALYEQGKVHHVGSFPGLEDEQCEWMPGASKSPNRIDALVWAITELMLPKTFKRGVTVWR